jgi:DNA-binding response OmpR family regulator
MDVFDRIVQRKYPIANQFSLIAGGGVRGGNYIVDCSVLIVEDELIVAEFMKTFLMDWGYDVIGVVPSGRTALNLVKDIRPDIMIMDVKINGDLNGVETAVVIRSFFEEEIPIIFISDYSIVDYPLIKALEKYSYLNKPFDSQDLLRALTNLGVEGPPDAKGIPDS